MCWQVCQILGVTEEQLNRLTLTPNTEHIESFKLYQRALHVFQGKAQGVLFRNLYWAYNPRQLIFDLLPKIKV